MKNDDIKAWLFAASVSLPYFSRGIGALTPVLRPGFMTVAVDARWRLYWSPEGLLKLLADQNDPVAVIQHELEHLLREHAARGVGRDVLVSSKSKTSEPISFWNICCDAEINDELVGKLGEKVWYPCKLGCPDHELAETYYDQCISAAGSGLEGESCGGGSGIDGVPREYEADEQEAPAVTPTEAGTLIDAVASDVRTRAGTRGDVPAGVLVWAEARLKKQKIPWRSLLRAQVRRAKAQVSGFFDYTYTRANRHQGRERIVLPGHQSPEIEVDLIVDTSGSMQGEGDVVAGVLESIQASVQKVNLISCDAKVHDQKRLKSWRNVKDLRGGGGTDLRKAFEVCKSSIVVVITDGDTPWPETAGGKKVVVVLCGGGSAPHWAKSIRVSDDAA